VARDLGEEILLGGNIKILQGAIPKIGEVDEDGVDRLIIQTQELHLGGGVELQQGMSFPMKHVIACIGTQGPSPVYDRLGLQQITCTEGVCRIGKEGDRLILLSPGYQTSIRGIYAIGGAMAGSMIGMIDSRWNPGSSPEDKTLLLAKAQECMLNLRHEEAAGQWCEKRATRILERAWLKKYLDKRLSPNTLHMSIIASDGTAVSITMSNGYGSGITIPGTGITCNNSLGEPELNPHGFFTLEPQQRFVSNMSPSIAWNKTGRVIAIGSPGASRITTTITQGWINLIHKGLDPQMAVDAPRLHVDYQDDRYVVQYEPGVNPGELKRHFKLRPFENRDMYFGALNIAIRDADGRVEAVADSRRHGATYHS